MSRFIENMLPKIGFGREDADFFINLSEKYKDSDVLKESVNNFLENPSDRIRILSNLREKLGGDNVSPYSLDMLLLIESAEGLYEKYRKSGLGEDLFYDTMNGLTCKLGECKTMYGVPGTFVADWFDRFYIPDRFRLGRLEYETSEFPEEHYEKDGFVLKKGDTVINMHIPSAGPLNRELVEQSLAKAYDFYKKDYAVGGKLAFMCSSWLLYKEHYDFLDKNSNILRFMDFFDIIKSFDTEGFHDCWRVFSCEYDGHPENLPENTKLQKALKKRLCDGKPLGRGLGVIIYGG